MDNQFSWKVNIRKGIQALLVGAVPAAMVIVQDALNKGEVDPKKISIGVGLSVTLGVLKSVQNWLKNGNRGKSDPAG